MDSNVDFLNLDILNKRGMQYAKSGKYEESIEYFKRVIEIDPQCNVAYYNIGISMDELGRYNEAIISYKI